MLYKLKEKNILLHELHTLYVHAIIILLTRNKCSVHLKKKTDMKIERENYTILRLFSSYIFLEVFNENALNIITNIYINYDNSNFYNIISFFF